MNPSLLRESSMSAWGSGRAIASRSAVRTPDHSALPTRSPPTVLETHDRVTHFSTCGRASTASQSSSISSSTRPLIRRLQPAVVNDGTTSAVSIR